MSLHKIDNPDNEWTEDNLDKMMVFCMLDRAMPYDKVCKAFNVLDENNVATREGIRKVNYPFGTELYIANLLKSAGFRFPKQTAGFLIEFSNNPIDLHTASRDEIVKNIKGVGYKLASMFLRNTRKSEYAVIDIHIKRYMTENGYSIDKSYKEIEQDFIEIANKLNKSVYDLDMEIWQERRIKLGE